MDEKNYSKRRLYGTLSWLIVGIYLVLNAGVTFSGAPLYAMLIVLPILNVVLILLWFFVRSFFNMANDPIKHSKYLISKAPELPLPKYGKGNGSIYVPNLKIGTELFNSINTKPNNHSVFDIAMKDYLKLERTIIFHDEMDYGALKKMKVSKVVIHEKDIRVSFSRSD